MFCNAVSITSTVCVEKADSLAVCEACTDFNIEEVLKENFALKNKVVVLRDELRLQSRTEVSEGR